MSAKNLNKKEPRAKKEKASKAPKPAKAPKPVKVKVKAKPDIYTLILLVAWIALTTACILLFLDIKSYSG